MLVNIFAVVHPCANEQRIASQVVDAAPIPRRMVRNHNRVTGITNNDQAPGGTAECSGPRLMVSAPRSNVQPYHEKVPPQS